MVFATHLYWNGGIRDMGPLTPLGQTGSSGVAVFFVLSGYLVYRPFARTGRAPLRTFATRRLLRIYPAYVFALLGVAVLFSKTDVMAAPLAYAALLQGVTGDSSALIPSWTLTVEVLFYASVPLLALVTARGTLGRQLGGLLFLGSLSLAGALLINVRPGDQAGVLYLSRSYPMMFWAFVPGMALGALDAHGHPSLAIARHPLTPLLGITLLWMGLLSGLNPWINVGVVAGSATLAAWVVVRRPPLPRTFSWFAAISYGFYLWQYDIIEALVSGGVDGPLLVLTGFVLTGAAAAVSYIVVEFPAIQFGRRITRSHAAPVTVHPPG